MEFSIGLIIQILLFGAAIVGIYVKLQIKMKEIEMKLIALEARVNHVEVQDEKIMNKLDEMYDSINEKLTDIKIELQNKQNK